MLYTLEEMDSVKTEIPSLGLHERPGCVEWDWAFQF